MFRHARHSGPATAGPSTWLVAGIYVLRLGKGEDVDGRDIGVLKERRSSNGYARPDSLKSHTPRLSAHRLLQVRIHLVEKTGGRKPLLVGADEQGEILRHESGFDGVDAHFFERARELR